MSFNTLIHRRYVKEYDSNVHVPDSLVDNMLQRAWKVTPSKNNFMPYQIHVLGPKHQSYKESVYLNAVSNESRVDQINLEEHKARYQSNLPNYANILNCSHLLIFTLRLETDPNPFQKALIERGHNYEAVDESRLNDIYPLASFEAGLFADAFSIECLENNIDVSFTGCFHRDILKWKDLPFVTRKPIMLMTIGKGKVYLDVTRDSLQQLDVRPDYSKIVNFID